MRMDPIWRGLGAVLGTAVLSGSLHAGDAVVASSETDEVLRYTETGAVVGPFVTQGDGGLDEPSGLCFGPDGDLYVSSRGTHEVLRYDGSTGAFLEVFVGAGAGGLSEPEGLCFSPLGNLLVASRGSDAVLEFKASNGAFLSVFAGDDPATPGVDESGGLLAPRNLQYAASGHLLVSSEHQVLRFHGLDGRRRGFEMRDGERGLTGARGTAVFSDGSGVVASQGNRRLLPLDRQPSGPGGPGRGTFSPLQSPSGLVLGPDGLLWVADRDADAVLRFTEDLEFVDAVIPGGSGGLAGPEDLTFLPPSRPGLQVPSGSSGETSSLDVWGAVPGSTVAFYEARTSGSDAIPDCGGLPSFLRDPVLLGTDVAAGDGSASISFFLDPARSEFRLAFQALDTTTCLLTPLALYRMPDSGSRAICVIKPGGDIHTASTYIDHSFRVGNSAGPRIISARLDLSTSLLPDQVYDPYGDAGDAASKDVDVNRDDGVGFFNYYYEGPHDGGFDVLILEFNDFDNGEIFEFSVDCDPTSIKGAQGPGPQHSGSVNGFELVGSTITYTFDDGSKKKRHLWRFGASETAGRLQLRPDQAAAPKIQVLGVSDPQVLTDPSQTVRVRGERGREVSLLVVEAGLYLDGVPGGGFDIDPFEANKAHRIEQYTATIGTIGFVDFPVTLLKSDPESGLYSLIAVQLEGTIGGRSSRIIQLEYDDGT